MPARPVERKPDGEESDKSNGYCSCNFSESCVFVSVRASAQSKARVRTSKLASAVYPLNVMCGTSFVGTLVYPSVVAGCFALCLLPLVWLWLLEPFQVGNDDMASGAVHSGSGALLLLQLRARSCSARPPSNRCHSRAQRRQLQLQLQERPAMCAEEQEEREKPNKREN